MQGESSLPEQRLGDERNAMRGATYRWYKTRMEWGKWKEWKERRKRSGTRGDCLGRQGRPRWKIRYLKVQSATINR